MIVPDASRPIAAQLDTVLRRMLAWGEARGESALGMLAVMWTAENRLGKFGASLNQVILRPWAYSAFNAGDPNRELLLKAPRWELGSWIRADAVAQLLEAGMTNDPTHGATHYCTAALWGRQPKNPAQPKWFEAPEIRPGRTEERARIGGHVFAVAP